MANQTNYIDRSGLSYCGTEANKIFSQDVYSLDIRNIGITMIDGVKAKRKIYLGKFDELWKNYTCEFNPDGGVVLEEQYIEPTAIKINKEFCRNEFWDSYLVQETEISLKGGIPRSFSEWYFTKLREEMSKEYGEIAFRGDTGYTGTTKKYLKVVDGWEKKLKSNTGVTKITASTFTVDNILPVVESVIQKGLELAAAEERPTDKLKVIMNYADVQLLRMALGKSCCPNNESIFSNYAKGADGKIYIYGFEIVETSAQSRNLIIFGDPRNLVLGFDTFSSTTEYKMIYMMDTTLDDMYRVAAISNIALGLMYPKTFVIGGAAVA